MALRNDDFRKLLATPRPGPGTGRPSQAPKAAKPRPYKPVVKGAAERDVGAPPPPVIRDRAQERRTGTNLDYTDTDAVAAQALTAEETRFLGGDAEHTHLVKGLDFALLQRVRAESRQAGAAADSLSVPAETPAPLSAPAVLEARTTTGRAILSFLFGPGPAQSSRFCKGSTTFMFAAAEVRAHRSRLAAAQRALKRACEG
jgi:IK cytokine